MAAFMSENWRLRLIHRRDHRGTRGRPAGIAGQGTIVERRATPTLERAPRSERHLAGRELGALRH